MVGAADHPAVLRVEGDVGFVLGEELLHERLGVLVDRKGDVAALAELLAVGAPSVSAEPRQDLLAQGVAARAQLRSTKLLHLARISRGASRA